MFVVLLIVDPSTRELGPPAIPGRFTTTVEEGLREGLHAIFVPSEIFVRRMMIDPMKTRQTVLKEHPVNLNSPGSQRESVDILDRVIGIGSLVSKRLGQPCRKQQLVVAIES